MHCWYLPRYRQRLCLAWAACLCFAANLNAHNLHFHKALKVLLQVALLRSEEFMLFRQNNTSMVLGTDMKKHFDIMSRFQVCSCFCIMTLHSLGANQPAAML